MARRTAGSHRSPASLPIRIRTGAARSRVVVQEPEGDVWLLDGHRIAGEGAERGESVRRAALREFWAETGLIVRLTGFLTDVVQATNTFATTTASASQDAGCARRRRRGAPPAQASVPPLRTPGHVRRRSLGSRRCCPRTERARALGLGERGCRENTSVSGETRAWIRRFVRAV
ncbi:MAG: NUDIX hydrolase [Candidatus Binatia bacterium]